MLQRHQIGRSADFCIYKFIRARFFRPLAGKQWHVHVRNAQRPSSSIPPQNTRDMVPGDVIILNDNYTRYKGELHIILKDMPNDGKKNVIGHIPSDVL